MFSLRQVLIYLVIFVLLLAYAISWIGRVNIEAVAVKQDGHILIVRSIFFGDQVEECIEDKLKLICQPYHINFQN